MDFRLKIVVAVDASRAKRCWVEGGGLAAERNACSACADRDRPRSRHLVALCNVISREDGTRLKRVYYGRTPLRTAVDEISAEGLFYSDPPFEC